MNGATMRLSIQWEGASPFERVYSSFRIDSDRLQAVTGFEAHEFDVFLNDGKPPEGKGHIIYTIRHLDLGEGKYYASVSLCRHILPKTKEAILHYVEKACTFSVRRSSPWHLSYVSTSCASKPPSTRSRPHQSGGARCSCSSLSGAAAITGVPTLANLCEVSGRDARLWAEEALREDLTLSILDHTKTGTHSSILEVGCASGFLAQLVAPRVSRYTGVDLSEHALHLARRLGLHGASFHAADGARLPFAEDSFDAAYCYACFHELPRF